MDFQSKKLVKNTLFYIILLFFFVGIFLIFIIEYPYYQKSSKMINKNYYYFFQSQSSYFEKMFNSYESAAILISNSSYSKILLKDYYKNKISKTDFYDCFKNESIAFFKLYNDLKAVVRFDKNRNFLFNIGLEIPDRFRNLPYSFGMNTYIQDIINSGNKKYIKIFSPIIEENKYLGYDLIFFSAKSLQNYILQNYTINNIDLKIDLYQIKSKYIYLKFSNYKLINNKEFVSILNKASHRVSTKFYSIGDYLFNFKRINYSNWFVGYQISKSDYHKITILSFIRFSLYIFAAFIFILIGVFFLLKPYSNKVILTIDQMDSKINELTRELKKERDRYLKYLDNIGNIFLVQKVNGDLIYINKKGLKLLGYKKEELLGDQWFKKVYDKESEILVKNLFYKIKNKDISTSNLTISPLYTKFKTKKIIQWTYNYLVDENNEVIEIFSSGIDITDKLKLYDEINKNIKQLDFIINSLNLFVWQVKIYPDQQTELTYLSKSFKKITGIDAEIILFSNYDYLHFVFPEDRKNIIELRKNVQTHNRYFAEYRFIKGNGDIVWLKDFAFLLKKEKNYFLINGFTIDITEEKKKENMLTSIFESISELGIGILMYGNINNQEGLIIYANNAITKITGYPISEIVNKKTVFEFLPSELQNFMRQRYRDRISGANPPSHFKTNIYDKNNNIRIVDLMITPQTIGDKKYIIAILIDNTEKEKMEQNMFVRQKMEALGLITSGIAHNLNNILAGMIGYLELLKMEITDEEHLNMITEILSGGSRAKKFISDLLGYSRKGKFEKRVLNINHLVQTVLNLLKPTMKKNIKIELDLDKEILPIEGDPDQLEQVIMNLCINASQAMPKGGTLTIKTENFFIDYEFSQLHYGIKEGQYIRLSVQDTGIGMDKKTLNKIFDPFFTTKKENEGTGLGLSTVYGIVKNHNGVITVYSEPGKGSIFKVYLPVTKSKPKETRLSKSKNLNLIKNTGTVLVIDDEKIILDVLNKSLNKLGFDVLLAKNGKEGISIYKKNIDKVKLIILDVNMPELSGKETFDKLKSLNKKCKILIATGFTLNEEVQELLDMGADGYIKKPFDLLTLSQKIGEILKDDRK